MIPILYDKNELDFESNGLGKLTDAVSCSVKEDINGEFTLTMVYPVDGIHYEDIKVRNYIYGKPNQTAKNQAFRIIKISRPINGQVTITAQHISYLLGGIIITPYLGSLPYDDGDAYTRFRIHHGDYLKDIIDERINSYILPEEMQGMFHFASNVKAKGQYDVRKGYYININGEYVDSTKDPDYYKLQKPIDVKSFLSGTDDDSIRGIFGLSEEDDDYGEFEFDMFNVYFLQRRGSKTDVIIKYGKDLTDLTYEDDISESYTSAVPYWPGNGSMVNTAIAAPVDMKDHGPDPDYIWTEAKVLDMSQDKVLQKDPEVVGTPEPQKIAERASVYMLGEKVWLTKLNLTISFVELWQTLEYENYAPIQSLGLGDELTVYYAGLGVNVEKRIISYDYDMLVERYSSITLGDPVDNVASRIAALSKETQTNYIRTTKNINDLKVETISRFEVDEGYIESSVQEMEISNGVIQYKVGTDIEQTPNKISFSVTGEELSKTTSAGIVISVNRSDGSSEKTTVGEIRLSGQVVFENDLGAGGTTVIDGGRIKTGTIEGITIISANGSNMIKLDDGVISIWDYGGLVNVGSLHYSYYNGTSHNAFYSKRGICLEAASNTGWIGFADEAQSSDYGEWGKNVVIINSSLLLPYLDGSYRGQTLLVKNGIYSKGSIDCNSNINCYKLSVSNDATVYGDLTVQGKIYADFDFDGLTVDYIIANSYINIYGSLYAQTQSSFGSRVTIGERLYVDGDFHCYSDGYISSDLYVYGRVISNSTGSSRYIKHDIRPIEDSELDPNKLYDLQVVQFKYNEQDKYAPGHQGHNMIGLIAEDVAEKYPAAASYRNKDFDKDKPLEVYNWDERSILAAAIQLIQNQKKAIDDLQIEVQKLHAEIDLLKIQNGS